MRLSDVLESVGLVPRKPAPVKLPQGGGSLARKPLFPAGGGK